MIVIVYGNPFDGLSVLGMFECTADATDYAGHYLNAEDWWVTSVEPKIEEETHTMIEGEYIPGIEGV